MTWELLNKEIGKFNEERAIAVDEPTRREFDRLNERVEQRYDQLDQKLAHIAELIEANTVQMGVFTEGLTRLELRVEEIAESSKRQAATAERQSETVDRLVALVDRLVGRN